MRAIFAAYRTSWLPAPEPNSRALPSGSAIACVGAAGVDVALDRAVVDADDDAAGGGVELGRGLRARGQAENAGRGDEGG